MVVTLSNQIPKEVVEKVQKSNDIVDIIGEYVQLKKKGRNYFGLCPFHGEKTPSFSVTPDKQIYYCFGCHKGGNVVNFMMEMEGYSFYEALSHLADKSGIKLPETVDHDHSLPAEQQEMLSAYEWLTKLYHHLLRYTKEGKEGYHYFKSRGITDESIDVFKLGFAPTVKNFTASFLEKKGIHQQLLVKAGLFSVHEGNTATDRFQGRVIYPIRNHLGKTVGFGGRSISDDGPKYLNSPETELFHKGKLLYNFDLAKKHLRKQNEVVLFEGYMDVISAFQAGVKNAVATMGTALTETQAKLLRRYVDTVILCFDGDTAGLEGTYKAAILLREVGCTVKVAKLRDNLDPDSFIQTYGSEAFRNEVIKASETYMAFFMRYAKKDVNLSVDGDRIKYINTVLKQLALLESSIELEYHLNNLSSEFGISKETLQAELHKYRANHRKAEDKREKDSYTNKVTQYYQSKKILPAFQRAERLLLAYMLQDKYVMSKAQHEIGANFNIDEHKIIATHLYAYYEEGHPADVSLFLEKLSDDRLKQLVIEIAMLPTRDEISEEEINDYIQAVNRESGDIATIKMLKERQKLAEQQNDPIAAAKLALEIIHLQKQMKQHN